MPVHKRTIRPVARLHGFWLYRDWLAKTASWPMEQRRAFVTDRLRKTLILAYDGIPFYRQRFDQAGFHPRKHFHQPSDLSALPTLTKEDVRAHGAEMVDRRFRWSSVVATTSGTTGQPTAMRLSEMYVALDYACMFRHWAKAGYHFRARYAALRSYVPKREGEPLWRFNWWQNTLYMSAYHLTPSNCEGYIEALLQFRPEYIRGYASSLNVLAEYAYPYRDQFGFVRGIFTASETVLSTERRTIERTFGPKLFDWYGMTEPAVVITERADHRGMEVEWEYGYPEFLEQPGLADDERRLLATSLHNPVMPFIRYETGDLVRLAEGESPGKDRLYPMVREVIGRKDDILVASDGRRMPSLNFYSLLQDCGWLLRFQFVQPGIDQMIVNLSVRPGTPEVTERLVELERGLRQRLGPKFALELKVTDDFRRSPDGKTPTFLSSFQATSVRESE